MRYTPEKARELTEHYYLYDAVDSDEYAVDLLRRLLLSGVNARALVRCRMATMDTDTRAKRWSVY